MIYLVSLNLWSPVNPYVEDKRSVNKCLISRMKERRWSVWCVFSRALNKHWRLNDACCNLSLFWTLYLIHLIFQIFLWINQLKMFNRDLRESRVWLKLLYFDQFCSRNHLLNKLGNHFIVLYLIYLQKFE